MDADSSFSQRYREALGRLEEDYRRRRDDLETDARRALEVEERRILENLERLLDPPGRARAEAFRARMDAWERRALPAGYRAPARSIDDLDVRGLHLVAQLDSALRHSIVETCLMNLRGFAEVLDERADDDGFLEKVAGQVTLLPTVAQQVLDFFQRPRVFGMALRDLLPLPCKVALAAVRGVLWVADRFRDPEAGRPPVPGAKLAAQIDELTQALTEVRRTIDGRRASLVQTVRQGVEALAPAVEAAGATLSFEYETDDDVRLFLEAPAIGNAVGELIRNALRNGRARDGTPPGIRVRVVEEPLPSTEVRIVVEDDGRGFDAEVLDRLGSGRVSTSGGGDGLALVRAAAKEHYGRVEVESPRTGGARVSIVLPRRAPCHEGGDESTDPSGSGS